MQSIAFRIMNVLQSTRRTLEAQTASAEAELRDLSSRSAAAESRIAQLSSSTADFERMGRLARQNVNQAESRVAEAGKMMDRAVRMLCLMREEERLRERMH